MLHMTQRVSFSISLSDFSLFLFYVLFIKCCPVSNMWMKQFHRNIYSTLNIDSVMLHFLSDGLWTNVQKLFINCVCCVSMVQWPLAPTSTSIKSSFDPTWLYLFLDMAMWLIKSNQVKGKICLGQQILVIKISLSLCKGLFQDFWFQLQKFPVLILLWRENNGFLSEDIGKSTLISSFCM